jgi:hypothetical protein
MSTTTTLALSPNRACIALEAETNAEGLNMSTQQVSLLVTPLEEQAIRGFCEIMDYTISQLIELAAVETMHRMGVFDAADLVGKHLAWADAPVRGKSEVAGSKITVSISPTYCQLAASVAKRLELGARTFLVGAALRYIGNKKRQTGSAAPLLQGLDVPSQYF